MRLRFRRHPLTRTVALLTLAALVTTSVPVAAAEAGEGKTEAPVPVQVNRQVPAVTPAPAYAVFSSEPTAAEIHRARVFGEPLVALGGTPSAKENRALAQALGASLHSGDITQRLAVVEKFVAGWPDSPWRASLLANLGVVYRRNGYFTRAERALTQAWDLSKGASDAQAEAVAGASLAELLELYMRFGRVRPLEELLGQVKDRVFLGSPADRIREARRAVWLLKNQHDQAIPSGPRALARIQAFLDPAAPASEEVASFHADEDGATLLEMSGLAQRAGLKLRAAVRGASAEIPLPAMMHFKVGHFSALLRREGDRFLIDDPCLGGEVWMSAEALEEEASGYFLIAQGALPPGWKEASDAEAEAIRGKCAIAEPGGEHTATCDSTEGEGCTGCEGLATYSFKSLLASVHIQDIPVGYTPPRGPAVRALVTYNQAESYKPLTYTFTNLGSRWNLVWVAWVEDNPANLSAPAYVHLAGGGRRTLSGFSGSSYQPERDALAVLTRTSSSPIRYERRLPDGTIEVYAQPDGAATSPRRVFMTEQRDPQGNALSFTYDAQLRLVAVSDAIGQVTTVSYELTASPLKVTKITDPFGRSARFEYDATGRLVSITDVIGMKSQFQYGYGDFIGTLTTPYGITTFSWSYGLNSHTDWGIEAVDPLGGRERIERIQSAPVPASEPPAAVPPGFTDRNSGLNLGSTFYWDKRAMALFPGDHTKAKVTKWNNAPTGGVWDSVSSMKLPLESRVWYSYPQQPSPGHWVGAMNKPAVTARVLDDGQAQAHRSEYGPRGNVCKVTDPLLRETKYTYGTGSTADADCATGTGIDLLRVEQKNGTGYDLAQSFTYNAQHRPLSMTDAAGQTSTATYKPTGEVETITTPARAGITENRTTTFTYDPAGQGYLQSATGPVAGATVGFTYDGYGRVRTKTDQAGHTLTYDYDALDRTTKTTYPDGSYEQIVYNRLDAEQTRDRLGRWTHTLHDALRREVTRRDPLGRTATKQWCTCGSLDKLIDANGNATTWERDLQGRIVKETRADNSFTQRIYENTTGRLKQRIDRKSQTKTHDYFLDDSLKQVTYSGAAVPTPTVSYTYHPAYSRRATMTDGTGTTTWTYNPITSPPALGAGLLGSISGPVGTSTYTMSLTYDELGRAISRSIDGATATQGFDPLGRVSSETDPLGAFTYTYVGATHRPNSVLFPNGQTTTYGYFDTLGDHRLQEIKHLDPASAVLSKYNYTYDKVGSIQTWSQQVGAGPAKLYTFGYDPAMQLTTAVISGVTPLPTPSRFAYAYDKAGNRIAEQLNDAVTGATYNNLDQLMSTQAGGALLFRGAVNEPATVMIAGQPAPVGADNSYQGTATVPSGTSTVTVVAQDYAQPPNVRTNTYQLSQSGAARTLGYDLNGNLTGDGTRTFEWDAEDRLVAINQGTHRSEFSHDGLGQRIRIVEKENTAVTSDKRFVWCGTRACQERDATGAVVMKAFYRHGILDGATKYFSTMDHLGSVREITDTAGVVRARYDYDPYGRTTKVSGTYDTTFGFTGHYSHAPSGLALPLFRAYSADLGRWTSEDPAGLIDGLNLYRYVRGNPVNYIDATGELTVSQVKCIAWNTVAGAAGGTVIGGLGGGLAGAAAGGGLGTLALPGGGTVGGGVGGFGAGAIVGAGWGAIFGAGAGLGWGLGVCQPPPTMCPSQSQSKAQSNTKVNCYKRWANCSFQCDEDYEPGSETHTLCQEHCATESVLCIEIFGE